MSNSETSCVIEGVANLNLKEEKANEDSKNVEAVKSDVDNAKQTSKSMEKILIATGGAEGGDGTQQVFSKERGPASAPISLPRFQLFSASSPYSTRKANAEYLARLIEEKNDLKALPTIFHFKHVVRLVNNEIAKLREELGEMTEVKEDGEKCSNEEKPAPGASEEATKDTHTSPTATSGKKIFLQEKIFVPVNEYPNYNFVGRILGPRGMTAKQLEEESGCRIMIRGRGSTREDGSHRQNMCNDHMKEELHVLVQCEDVEEVAKEKVKRAVECIRYMLIPPPEGEDELKRKQLMELSIINGTYRPTNASRMALHNRTLLPPLNFGQLGTESSIRGMNNTSGYKNGGIEDDKRNTLYDQRTGMSMTYGAAQYPFNAYTVNTRQALASLGFDMDAFEIADCYGKRLGKTSPGIPSGQVAAAAAAAAAQFSRPYGLGAPIMDPFNMQYMWNPSINPSMFGVFENSPNALAKEYCNQVMAGSSILSPAMSGNGASIGDGVAQSSNVPPVNLQQYITAAALLSGAPTFRNDGSGDGPSNHR